MIDHHECTHTYTAESKLIITEPSLTSSRLDLIPLLPYLRALGLDDGSQIILPSTNNSNVTPTASVTRDSNSIPVTNTQPANVRPASRRLEAQANRIHSAYTHALNKIRNEAESTKPKLYHDVLLPCFSTIMDRLPASEPDEDIAEAMKHIRRLLGEARKDHESEDTGGSSNNKRRRCR